MRDLKKNGKKGRKHLWKEKLIYICTRNRKPSMANDAGVAQLVEHNLAKVGVAGPSPVSRSFF